VHVYVDATGFVLTATASRPDVAATLPRVPAEVGFDANLAVGPGPHQVCVYAIDVAPGLGNKLLGCRLLVL